MNYKAQRLPKLTNLKYEVENKKYVQSQQKRAVKQQFYIFPHFRKYLTVFVKFDIFSVVYILASRIRNYELNVLWG